MPECDRRGPVIYARIISMVKTSFNMDSNLLFKIKKRLWFNTLTLICKNTWFSQLVYSKPEIRGCQDKNPDHNF